MTILLLSFVYVQCKVEGYQILKFAVKIEDGWYEIEVKNKFSKIEVKVWRWCSKLNDLIRIWALLLQFADTFWRWSLKYCIEVEFCCLSLKLKIKV